MCPLRAQRKPAHLISVGRLLGDLGMESQKTPVLLLTAEQP